MEQQKIQISANIISALFGSFDSNIKKIESEFNVTIINRGDDVDIIGESKDIEKAVSVINSLIGLIESGESIDTQNINYIITETNANKTDEVNKLKDDIICMTISGRALKPKTWVRNITLIRLEIIQLFLVLALPVLVKHILLWQWLLQPLKTAMSTELYLQDQLLKPVKT